MRAIQIMTENKTVRFRDTALFNTMLCLGGQAQAIETPSNKLLAVAEPNPCARPALMISGREVQRSTCWRALSAGRQLPLLRASTTKRRMNAGIVPRKVKDFRNSI